MTSEGGLGVRRFVAGTVDTGVPCAMPRPGPPRPEERSAS